MSCGEDGQGTCGKPYFFKIEVVVEIPHEDHKSWDSGCDETFGVSSYIPHTMHGQRLHITDYRKIEEEEYNGQKHRIFDSGGGI